MTNPNIDRLAKSSDNLPSFFGSGPQAEMQTPAKKATEKLNKRTVRRTVEELTQSASTSKKSNSWLNSMMSDLLMEAHHKRGVKEEPDANNIMQMKLLDLNSEEADKVNKKRLAKITRGGAHEGTLVLKKLDRDKETGKIARIRRGIYIGGEESTGGSIPFSFIYPFLVDAYQLSLQGQGYTVETLLQDSDFIQILDLLADLTGEITSDVFRHNKKQGGLVEFDGIPGKQFTVKTVSNDFNGQYQTPLKLVAEYYRDLTAETTPAKLKEIEKQLKHFENAYESLLSRKDKVQAKINIALERLKEERLLSEERKKEIQNEDATARARFVLDLKPDQPVDDAVRQKMTIFNKWLNQMARQGLMSTVPGSKYEETVDIQLQEFAKVSKEIAAIPGNGKLLTLSVLYSRYKNAKTSGSGGLGTFMMKALVSQYGEFVKFQRDGNQVSIVVDLEKSLQNWIGKANQTVNTILKELENGQIEQAVKLLDKFPEKNYAIVKMLLEKLVVEQSDLLTQLQNAMMGFPTWKIQEIKDLVNIISKKEGLDKNTEELWNFQDYQDYLQPIVGETLAPLLTPEAETEEEEDIPVASVSLSPVEENEVAETVPTLMTPFISVETQEFVNPLPSQNESLTPLAVSESENTDEIIMVKPLSKEAPAFENNAEESEKKA